MSRFLPDFSDWVWWKVRFDDDPTIVVIPAPRDIGAITGAMAVLGLESFKHAKAVPLDEPDGVVPDADGWVHEPNVSGH